MYNRYTPQPDGTYRRVREEAPGKPVHPSQPREAASPAPPEPHGALPPAEKPSAEKHSAEKPHTAPPPQQPALPGFLQNLIPAGMDTEDLLIILLILLTAGKDEEAKNSAMLTIALYFAL